MRVIAAPDEFSDAHGGVLVPTMGALHAGHSGLFDVARRAAAARGVPLVATIFVNPTQFNEAVDFDRYPRDEAGDLAIAREAGVDLVVTPAVADVYPPGATDPVPPLPPVATRPGLEDRYRPGHLEGVAQVVSRLFDLLRPAAAVFGEKDIQQLLLIRGLVDAAATAAPDRWPGLEILGAATVREDDGVALSSRNRLLPADARAAARGIPRALQVAHAAQQPETAERMMRETLEAHGLEVEYAVVRDAVTLEPIADFTRPARGLIAAKAGDVRLIDNQRMTVWS